MTLCSGVLQKEEVRSLVKEKRSKDGLFDLSVDLNHDDFYFPSVELLTAQVRPRNYPPKRESAQLKRNSICSAFRTSSHLSCWT